MSDKSKTFTSSDREDLLERASMLVDVKDSKLMAKEIEDASKISSLLGNAVRAYAKHEYKDAQQDTVLAALSCAQIYVNKYLKIFKKQLEEEQRHPAKKRRRPNLYLLDTARCTRKAVSGKNEVPK